MKYITLNKHPASKQLHLQTELTSLGSLYAATSSFQKKKLCPGQGLYYGDIGQLVMRRTAREAVDLIALCVETFGFAGFSEQRPYLIS